jgi:hypothetical protein
MPHTKEDFVSGFVISDIIDKPAFLLDEVFDSASLFNKFHEVLVRNDSHEGFVLWFCSGHVTP